MEKALIPQILHPKPTKRPNLLGHKFLDPRILKLKSHIPHPKPRRRLKSRASGAESGRVEEGRKPEVSRSTGLGFRGLGSRGSGVT